MSPLTATRPSIWTKRRARAAELGDRLEYAREPLALYSRLLDARETAHERALAERPDLASLAAWTVEHALPGVMDATMEAGTELLREAVLLRFHEGDLAQIVAGWLRGDDLSPTDTYLARAAAGPALEALPATARELRFDGAPAGACPHCSGAPQLGYFGATDEALVTGPRFLVCARCSHEWIAPRMTCASCGETDSAKLQILDAVDLLPHMRIDACDTCQRYLLTIDMRKDPAAVAEVDEIAALPLDLEAKERGYMKIAPDLLGF